MERKPTQELDPVEFARDQRKRANEFAAIFWQMVRDRRILGEKFRREHPLGIYTLDFVCLDLRLAIEIDGKGHLTEDGRSHDERRDAFLRSEGFEVLRIPGYRLTQDSISVRNEVESIVRRLRALTDSK